MLILHGARPSSASSRVRIALNIKGLEYTERSYNLATGEQRSAAHLQCHPQGLVPVLECEDGRIIQSGAIIEYLEERVPTPRILPPDAATRAAARAIFALVASDIHPVVTKRVCAFLKDRLAASDDVVRDWQRHWVTEGFDALEAMLGKGRRSCRYCVTDYPTVADIALVPQVMLAERLGLSLKKWPGIVGIVDACLSDDGFAFGVDLRNVENDDRLVSVSR